MYRTIPIMCTLVVLYTSVAFRPKANRDCVKFPTGRTWSGTASQGNQQTYSRVEAIHMKQLEENIWWVSDFTAGYFAEFEDGGHPAEIRFHCDHTVRQSTFESPFGQVIIRGGRFDHDIGQLTLHWEIPSNGLSETSRFQVTGS
jgi:hypothetical protein